MRILIANRGEIARRVMTTAHQLGHSTVAVFADPDSGAPHVAEATRAVRLGPADLASSYLSIDALLDAAASTGADAVHPGYGFLSEDGAFARAVTKAGLIWIGPQADAIDRMGSKIEARCVAAHAGVPTIPGFAESQDDDALWEAAEAIGYPVLIKAASGGGGKGIRVAGSPAEFKQALRSARAEASRAFGDDAVIVERYVAEPRHVEVQVVGDRHGTVMELGTRECSVQRRYQKLFEEAPAPGLADDVRAGLRASAIALAEAIDYDSAGTVEFIVDDKTGEYFFLEMNTRLQVEHPVTEAVTGLDLVELQIRCATGEPLPIGSVAMDGHAVEARINAEDPAAEFAPQTGTVTDLVVPEGVRWDAGVVVGSNISPHYDPMVAKLVVHGPDRSTALRRTAATLDRLLVGGVLTNIGFHRWLVDQAPVVAGRVTTRFLDEVALPEPPAESTAAEVAARAWVAARDRAAGSGPWSALRGFRTTPHPPRRRIGLRGREDHEIVIDDVPATPPLEPHCVDLGARRVVVSLAGWSTTFEMPTRTKRWAPQNRNTGVTGGAIIAPFPGTVTAVEVASGQPVAGGDVVLTLEAMKMLNPLTAEGPGIVDEVRVTAGDQVDGGQVLVTFQPFDEDEASEEAS